MLLGGAEAWRTRTSVRQAGGELDWTKQDDDVPAAPTRRPRTSPCPRPASRPAGVIMPIQVYPLFEQAHRIELGRGLDEHLVAMSELWARFSEVAATNPHAWIQQAYTAGGDPHPVADNRMIGFPYTKLMNSNNAVEQGAGVILCSAERAEALGVPRDRWVFPHSGTDAHDHYFVSNRDRLGRSPAMRIAGAAALELAGVGVDDLAHVDLYSCFPSAVEIAADELGLGTDRPLTVTGGLSLRRRTVEQLRDALDRHDGRRAAGRPGQPSGSCTANGGFITKHTFGVYGTEPPAGAVPPRRAAGRGRRPPPP